MQLNANEVHGGISKVDRHKWETTLGPAGRYELLDKTVINIDKRYQRDGGEVAEGKVLDIARKFNWLAFGVVTVAKRGDEYYAVDAGHRVRAALKRQDVRLLPCLVFELPTAEEEARGFRVINRNRRAVPALTIHKAASFEGDALARRVNEAIADCGLTLTPNAKTPGTLKCVALCSKLAKEDHQGFRLVLRICADISSRGAVPVKERLLLGLWYLHRNVANGFSDSRLRDRVYAIGAPRLLDAAARAAAYYTRGGDAVFGRGMLEEINKGLRNRFAFVGEEAESLAG